MLPHEQMDYDQRLDFMKGALLALDVRPPRSLRVPLFESIGALACLRRGFPAEMRSKQYLGPYLTFWVTFRVTLRVNRTFEAPYPRTRQQPRAARQSSLEVEVFSLAARIF